MMIVVVQSEPELAKNAPRSLAQDRASNGGMGEPESSSAPRLSIECEPPSPYVIDLPVDMSALEMDDSISNEPSSDQSEPYMFVPPEPRPYYRFLVKECIMYDLSNVPSGTVDSGPNDQTLNGILAKRSIELLNEVGLRWRIPYVSRLLLFLDVIREMFIDQHIDIEAVHTAFLWVRNPPSDRKKGEPAELPHVSKWTIKDYVLKQQILTSIHDMLLRDLYAELQKCYEVKPPDIGAMMEVLEQHVYDDPLFSKTPEDLDQFGRHLQTALEEKSRSIYQEIYDAQIRANTERLEFFHVVQLGNEVLKLCEKIQKRYRKTPRIMGWVSSNTIPFNFTDKRSQSGALHSSCSDGATSSSCRFAGSNNSNYGPCGAIWRGNSPPGRV